MSEIACRHCGNPIERDNVDDLPEAPPEVISAMLIAEFGTDALARFPARIVVGNFWRHSDTDEETGFTLCPGKRRYAPDATYAEP